MSNTGKVWLVGAGPGDVGLLTLRALEVLKAADVVVYDRLVGSGVMALVPENTKLIDVGKSGGNHPVPQREIEKILVDHAKAGKRVVRLKGGDPFLFGRGSEEALTLIENNIAFEIVPGVTSAIAVPAWAGIPVTHRALARSLEIITAHTKENNIPDLDYSALAGQVRDGGTLVLLMGVAHAGAICEKLIEAGLAPDTSAAAIERGTTARQKKVLSNLAGLADAMKNSGMKPPAILVIGPTVTLAEKLDWRKNLLLDGVRVAVTRPKDRSGRLVKMLRDEGAEVLEMPCIATEIIFDETLEPLDLHASEHATKLTSDYASAHDHWAVFTSATGVEALIARLAHENRDIRELGDAKLAAIGPATANAIRAHGLKVDLMPDIYDGENLGLALVNAGAKFVLLLRAQEHGPELTQVLREHNINYREVPMYRTIYLDGAIPPGDELDMAIFTSASTVKAFAARVQNHDNRDWDGWGKVQAVCIGKQTANAAESVGFKKIEIAKSATLESLVQAAINARARAFA